MARGEDLYHLDEGALAGLDADLVVTQDLCAVCAVDVSVVDDALAHLGCTRRGAHHRPAHPRRGARVDRARSAGPPATRTRPTALVADQRPRLDAVVAPGRRAAAAAGDVPRVDRPAVRARATGSRRWSSSPAASRVLGTAGREVAPGHLGRRARRRPGRRGRARRAATTASGAAALADELVASGVLPAGVPVHAVDANASWARPGTRLVDGVEELARLHPPTP